MKKKNIKSAKSRHIKRMRKSAKSRHIKRMRKSAKSRHIKRMRKSAKSKKSTKKKHYTFKKGGADAAAAAAADACASKQPDDIKHLTELMTTKLGCSFTSYLETIEKHAVLKMTSNQKLLQTIIKIGHIINHTIAFTKNIATLSVDTDAVVKIDEAIKEIKQLFKAGQLFKRAVEDTVDAAKQALHAEEEDLAGQQLGDFITCLTQKIKQYLDSIDNILFSLNSHNPPIGLYNFCKEALGITFFLENAGKWTMTKDVNYNTFADVISGKSYCELNLLKVNKSLNMGRKHTISKFMKLFGNYTKTQSSTNDSDNHIKSIMKGGTISIYSILHNILFADEGQFYSQIKKINKSIRECQNTKGAGGRSVRLAKDKYVTFIFTSIINCLRQYELLYTVSAPEAPEDALSAVTTEIFNDIKRNCFLLNPKTNDQGDYSNFFESSIISDKPKPPGTIQFMRKDCKRANEIIVTLNDYNTLNGLTPTPHMKKYINLYRDAEKLPLAKFGVDGVGDLIIRGGMWTSADGGDVAIEALNKAEAKEAAAETDAGTDSKTSAPKVVAL